MENDLWRVVCIFSGLELLDDLEWNFRPFTAGEFGKAGLTATDASQSGRGIRRPCDARSKDVPGRRELRKALRDSKGLAKAKRQDFGVGC
jgi:hypothetical protein